MALSHIQGVGKERMFVIVGTANNIFFLLDQFGGFPSFLGFDFTNLKRKNIYSYIVVR
jgi:hypothetical protein